MNLQWKLVSSLTRAGSMLRIVVWAARIDAEGERTRRYIYRECVYQVGHDGLLLDEDEHTKRILQTKYGHEQGRCIYEQLDQVLSPAKAGAPQPSTLPC